jgi:cell division protease FtsH
MFPQTEDSRDDLSPQSPYTGGRLTPVASTFLRNLISWVVPVLLFVGSWHVLLKHLGPAGRGGDAVRLPIRPKGYATAQKDIFPLFVDVASVD